MLTVYSTPTCGKCQVIKTKLNSKGIQFLNCQDIDIMQSLNITSVPCLKTDDGKMIRNFSEINSYVNSL